MSTPTRPHLFAERPVRMGIPCQDRALALDLLQGFSLPEACNVETWLDRIESSNGREARP